MADSIQKFLLNDLNVRGALVHLTDAWQELLRRRDYSDEIMTLLGEACAANLLMSASIKYDGKILLQLQSAGDLSLLVVQTDNQYRFRAMANVNGDASGQLTASAPNGLIAIIVEAEKGKEPYQGIVSVAHDKLSDNLETYFTQSEQLKTLLVLRADRQCAVGVLLQVLPSAQIDEDDWARLRYVAETLNIEEMQTIDSDTAIARLFAEEDKTLYPSESVHFLCTCSEEGTLGALATLDKEELAEMVAENEPAVVICDFCGQSYSHDAQTLTALLSNKRYPN